MFQEKHSSKFGPNAGLDLFLQLFHLQGHICCQQELMEPEQCSNILDINVSKNY